jgi:hypothetical protein
MGSGETSRDTVGNAPSESELSFGHFLLQFPVGIFQRVAIPFYAEVGKVTSKINGDEALSDESV